jgi:signal transduction histidine kinase
VRLEQVFSNLLGNAVRHGAPGSIAVTLRGGDSDCVEFTVHNAGAIPEDVVNNIFDPFRSSERRARAEGLGLGLYIVRQIVLAHGGSIEVTSTQEAGTTFRVALARAKN